MIERREVPDKGLEPGKKLVGGQEEAMAKLASSWGKMPVRSPGRIERFLGGMGRLLRVSR